MRHIDSTSVFLGRPCYFRPVASHTTAIEELIYNNAIGGTYCLRNVSVVQMVRDQIAHFFLRRTTCEWLCWIDDDITFSQQDWTLLLEQHGNEKAVCAEYMKKTQDLSPQIADFGLGFARVHRSVYEALDDLRHEDNTPRVPIYRERFDAGGKTTIEDISGYHWSGAGPDGRRINEDHGFWMLVALAGIEIRKETRTHLGHTGEYTWWYDPSKVEQLKEKLKGTR